MSAQKETLVSSDRDDQHDIKEIDVDTSLEPPGEPDPVEENSADSELSGPRGHSAAVEDVVVNGVDAATGEYAIPPLSVRRLAALIRSDQPMPASASGRSWMPDIDPADLAQAGWGVIFPETADSAVYEALRPLLEHRRGQAASGHANLYREFKGEDGVWRGEDRIRFLSRHGASFGPVDPLKMPYFLLIVGDPEEISYDFQYQLGVSHAVGRLALDTPEDYASYAANMVKAETKGTLREPLASFFGVCNKDDKATQLTSRHLVAPLAQALAKHGNWRIETTLAQQATKTRLGKILSEEAPALLFTASHGMSLEAEDPRQASLQGALICQDWPGPDEWRGPLPARYYFSAEDVASNADLTGLLAFFFACHSGGVASGDAFAHRAGGDRRVAERSLVAQLPQQLLRRGALAVVGHIDRAWGYSYLWPGVVQQTQTFEAALSQLLKSLPIGLALSYFGARYGQLSAALNGELERARRGDDSDEATLVRLWTAANDARGHVILGDPAARLMPARGAGCARSTLF